MSYQSPERIPDPSWKYDVFLSFRGSDTRYGFISHLYQAFNRACIDAFIDDWQLLSGNQNTDTVIQAIEASRVSVVVFSANYASSIWCLDELTKIMECQRTKGQTVIPVFYDVDPTDVRHQRGAFKEAFQRYEERFSHDSHLSEKIHTWRAALTEAASIRGVYLSRKRNEADAIREIVEHLNTLLESENLFITEHPVGVQSRIKDVIQQLNDHKPDDVVLMGIWGMGGVGKTTIATAVYNQIRHDFDSRKFLPNIREMWENNQQVFLQEQLLNGICKAEIHIQNIKSGVAQLKKRLRLKRIFIVLDDVDNVNQLEALCGGREWFGPGSIIIITTRDRRLLRKIGVDHVYQVKEMDYNESLELFCWNAFNQATLLEKFAKLTEDVVAYCGGLPLALATIGRELSGKMKIDEWENVLGGLKRRSHPDVHKVLKISYDGLNDDTQKEIFLDIASFYIGKERGEVLEELYNSFGLISEDGNIFLEEQSLITFDEEDRIQIHPLMRQMATEIMVRHPSKTDEPQSMSYQSEERTPDPSWKYDVFLSFQGLDTRDKFIKHLHQALKMAGIHAFIEEDEKLRIGDEISYTMFQAIEASRVSIIVFSPNYAASKWCLDELTKIMECVRTIGQAVIPVFYNVDPAGIRHPRGSYGEAFQLHLKRSSHERVHAWRAALIESAKLHGGFDTRGDRNEAEITGNIVEHVTELLVSKGMFITSHPVVGQSRKEHVIRLLHSRTPSDVMLMGIWGMAGVGKTTLAKVVYDEIRQSFDRPMFLPNIREMWENNQQVFLQEQLLNFICNAGIQIQNIASGVAKLKEKLCQEKVLIVLDDVSNIDQLNALCGSREWFGPGSVIIITTRDRRLLREIRVDRVYQVTELDSEESLELFRRNAFSQATPLEEFDRVEREVVAYCGGLPLALVTIGRELFGKLINEWENVLGGLKTRPHADVNKVSYDGLNDDIDKEIFLDIASFCIGMKREEVLQTLEHAFGIPVAGISFLEEQSLITIDHLDKVRIHHLLRDMGREIVRELSQTQAQERKYDVFVSFRGGDTRLGFTSHLHEYLRNAPSRITVFKDDDDIDGLKRGERISMALLKAIGLSACSVIVLSTNYADSKWCLQELENIMVCHRTKGQLVFPIFYGVDPADVRYQRKESEFGKAFASLINGKRPVEADKVQRWKADLFQVSNFSGMNMINSRNESEDIKKIVEDVARLLKKTEMPIPSHPVGVASRVQKVIEESNIQRQTKAVLILGVKGMGGIGKTTIAKVIYNQIGRDFQARSFLQDIRERWQEENGKVGLQQQLLEDILGATRIHISNTGSGKKTLEDKLRGKRVLIVLDDVDDSDQLNDLCGSGEWCGPESKVIITTRNNDLLRVCGDDQILEIPSLDADESLELFSWHAFKQAYPKEKFDALSKQAVEYCNGLPLALELLGSHLFGRDMEYWQLKLDTLKSIPHDKVNKILRISFDGLSNHHSEKEIFLHIVCFFIGMDQNEVIPILTSCGFLAAEMGINVLNVQNLITVDKNNMLGMHELLRDMGRAIIREQSPELEERSTLWYEETVLQLLRIREEGTDLEKVKGLSLKLPTTISFSLSEKTLKIMPGLKLLQLASVEFYGEFKHLSRNLRWMSWNGFPLTHTPMDCYQPCTVSIELENSKLQVLWRERPKQPMNYLKILNLSHSHNLIRSPDFSWLPNLEKLVLKDCIKLSSISDSIGTLEKIRWINLEGCTNLFELPRSIYKLKFLETFILSGCSKIVNLEKDVEQMKSLKVLKADKTGIVEVPKALERLRNLVYISVAGYEGKASDVIPLIMPWSSSTINEEETENLHVREISWTLGSGFRSGLAAVLDWCCWFSNLETSPI
ncbi:hypothetical protein PIB30_014840 [Stylosanthes scabra]|uniref:TIR domain-containing protein n=1 Tax=Stylosanthes scabra TaxID=79078 RepID=A0ABU6R757_9FABA|nr:hypothetical protein [Stylosanthes scabra]